VVVALIVLVAIALAVLVGLAGYGSDTGACGSADDYPF
jgi:hypothetical protein